MSVSVSSERVERWQEEVARFGDVKWKMISVLKRVEFGWIWRCRAEAVVEEL